jgi:DNA-binding NarL/FixJ family response regulator
MTDKISNKSERPRARVLLVDDHALVREQLTSLIQAEADLVVCGEAEDAPKALALIRQQKPDLVILDISLKRSNGLDLLKDLKELRPKPTVLVLSMHEEIFYAERALRAGALGYITKEEATINILLAIRHVLSGHVYLSDRMAGPVMEKLASAGQAIAKEARV